MKIVGLNPIVPGAVPVFETGSNQARPLPEENSRNVERKSDRKIHDDRDTDLPNQIVEAILRRVAKDSQYTPNDIGVMATYPNWGWSR